MSSPVPAPAPRGSVFSRGGPNSLSNFASSYQRAQTYLESNMGETYDSLSPCTSVPEEPGRLEAAIGSIDETAQIDGENESAAQIGNYTGTSEPSAERNNLDNYHFPNEETPLNRRRSSRLSVFSGFDTGSSTAPQTVFNSINTLLGIAMLSLPFGLRLSGWLCGSVILAFCCWITAYTAKVLGSVLRSQKHLNTYADIAHAYGGSRFQMLATVIFTVDLIGASISLVLIFSDSFSLLFPQTGAVWFKLAIISITLFSSFLPLSVVSLISVVGLLCTAGIFFVIVLCGLTSSTVPGSLLSPTVTSLWPNSWQDLFFSLGIFMAPWGGHPVFPELYRDMRHPKKYAKCCNITFSVTVVMDGFIAAVGYLMYGNQAMDSLTKNVMANPAYPRWVTPVVSVFLGLLPVSKLALITRPLISVYEKLVFGSTSSASVQRPSPARCVARVLFMAAIFGLSVAFTSFGKVVAFLGSAICFTICVTFPLMFHLKFNRADLSSTHTLMCYGGIVIGTLGAVLGTYGAIVSQTS